MIPEYLERMLDTIRHRGPDDRGTYINGSVGLGHQRLSIIDIEGGRQPMAIANGRIQVIYNGEIYNFQELRRDLEKAGFQFRTRSDTEVVIAAYATWGLACVEKFNGIFAFAIWDDRSKSLVLARDAAGVKPLYYYVDSGKLLFASEIKSLLTDPEIPRVLDLAALDAYLTFRYVPAPLTLLKGVRKLQPGHTLRLSADLITIARNPQQQVRQMGRINETQLREEVLRRLDEAVERQMVSDVDVGLLLSGGMDSCALLALMNRHTDRPVKTFTVGFEGDAAENETADARRMAKHFNADHHEILMGAIDYRDSLSTVIGKLEEPICTTSIIPFHLLSELAGRTVKVALSGQGADEEFAGYRRYIGEHLGGTFRKLPRFAQSILRKAIHAAPIRGETLRRGARALGNDLIGRRFVETYSVYGQDERSALYSDDSGVDVLEHWDYVDALRAPVSHLKPLDQMLYVDVRSWLPNDLLLYTDKLSMAYSLEVRVPFLDLEFLNFAESIPASWKLRNFRTKHILKEAVGPLLPVGVVDRKKKGFPTPVGRWLRDELGDYARDVLLASDAASGGLFDRSVMENMIDSHIKGKRDYERQIFTLLVFEIWERLFMKSSTN